MPTVRPGVVAKISEAQGILGCINEHDGSGYLHAMLQAYHPGYSRQQSDHYRTNLAKSVRIGALPAVLRSRYGPDPLCAKGCQESRLIFNQAIAYGSTLPAILMRNYAEYLGVAYRLYDANLSLIEEYQPAAKRSSQTTCHIVVASEDEYHLLVGIVPSKRGDPQGTVRFRVLS